MKNEFKIVGKKNIVAFLESKEEIFTNNYKEREVKLIKDRIFYAFDMEGFSISRGLANYWLRRLDNLVIRDDTGREIYGEASMSDLLPQLEVILHELQNQAELSTNKVANINSNKDISKKANCPKPWSCDKRNKKKALTNRL